MISIFLQFGGNFPSSRGSHLEKKVTRDTMGHTWIDGSLLMQWVKLEKGSHSRDRKVTLKKCVTLGNMQVTLRQLGHI